ncbi:acyltransferase [Legionella feeleii]|uniref:Chloramphenicol acetyltransferase n=1 Tax=Legionella feeleii TaxID=453 RepID=A0A378IZM0_9GAMM|nr:acyltransferase [Legionella feeleii]STX39941.1 chloramphenicol acetyltransferase [Legionella feeleii]
MSVIQTITNSWRVKYPNTLFLLYSYFSTLCAFLLDFLPPFIRNLIFKTCLGKFGEKTLIDYKVYMRYFRNIEIGHHVAINRGCELYTSYHLAKKIVIGNHVTISPNVTFYGAAQDYHYESMPDIAGDIIVEDNCWICANSTILPGVTIGKGSVIGAGSVVTKNIPPNSVAVGNPARVIKERVYYEN